MAKEKVQQKIIIKVLENLDGMLSICQQINRSETTALKLIRTANLPAKKMGGVWISNKVLIDRWKELILIGDGSHMDMDFEETMKKVEAQIGKNR